MINFPVCTHAGYDANPRYLVTGLSQLHENSTGGRPALSNFKLFPLPHCPLVTVKKEDDSPDVQRVPRCKTSINARQVVRRLRVEPINSTKKEASTEKENANVSIDGTVADDIGHPGYFLSNLSSGVRVELTAARRTALHRYTFSSQPTN